MAIEISRLTNLINESNAILYAMSHLLTQLRTLSSSESASPSSREALHTMIDYIIENNQLPATPIAQFESYKIAFNARHNAKMKEKMRRKREAKRAHSIDADFPLPTPTTPASE